MKWLAVCAALALGEAAGLSFARFGACWPVPAVLSVHAALLGYAFRVRAWPYAAVFLAGLAAAMAASASRNAVLDAADAKGGSPFETVVRVVGECRTRPFGDDSLLAFFGGRAGSLPVRVSAVIKDGSAVPRAGDRWLCRGWLERDAPPRGGVRRFWVRGRGSCARQLEDDFLSRAAAVSRRLRSDLSRRLAIGLDDDGESAAVARAMLLGDRRGLPRELRDDFAAAGTIHVFAVSGLHVTVVAQAVLVALALLFVSVRAAGAVLVPVLWAYVFVVGFPASAVRAALMATFYSLAPLFWRRRNALVAWCAAFVCVHAASPHMLLDVGCRMSFTVVLAMIVWMRTIRQDASGLMKAASVTAVAWAAGVPIAAQTFGRISPGGLLANLAAVPAAGVGTAAGAAGWAASFVSGTVAAHVNNLAALATGAMTGLSRLAASVDGASVEVEPWSWRACAMWYAALATVFLFAALRRSRSDLL